MTSAHPRVTAGQVFANGEFRVLWLAELLSVFGDQLARVGLSVLVFDSTGSAAATGLAYALTYLPSILGGALLSGLADRFPRREVMVACDLVCAVLVAVVAIRGMPLGVVAVAVAGVSAANAPFRAARLALLGQVLDGEQLSVGVAIRQVTLQSAQLAGFAGGGVLIALINPYVAMGIDAATFAVSALLLRLGLRRRPASGQNGTRGPRAFLRNSTEGFKAIRGNSGWSALVVLAWIAGCYIAPEALAVVYAHELGGGPVAAGLIMAAQPLGMVAGVSLLTRFVPWTGREALIGPLAVASGIPLVVCLVQPGLEVSLVLFAACGALQAYNAELVAAFVRDVPDNQRATVMGLESTGLMTAQGVGIFLLGVAADALGAGVTIAVAGALGLIVAVPAAIAWSRYRAAIRGDLATGAA